MDAVRYADLGENIESWSAGWQIAGLRIDNPTGSWLFIPEANRYVPPFTLSWATSFEVKRASVSIRYTDSPSGSLSQQIGGPIKVQIFDTPIGESSGFASGTGAQNPLAPPSEFTRVLVQAGDPTLLSQTQLVPAVVGQRIVLVSAKLAWTGEYPAWGSFYGYLARNNANPPIDIYGILACTPETPADALRYNAGSVKLPDGVPLMIYAAVTGGLASEVFTVVTEFYYTGE